MIAGCLRHLRKKITMQWKGRRGKTPYWITHLDKDNTFKMLLFRIKTISTEKKRRKKCLRMLLYRNLLKKSTISPGLCQAPLVNTSLHRTLQLHRTVTSTKLILDWSILVIYAYHHYKQMSSRTHFVIAS